MLKSVGWQVIMRTKQGWQSPCHSANQPSVKTDCRECEGRSSDLGLSAIQLKQHLSFQGMKERLTRNRGEKMKQLSEGMEVVILDCIKNNQNNSCKLWPLCIKGLKLISLWTAAWGKSTICAERNECCDTKRKVSTAARCLQGENHGDRQFSGSWRPRKCPKYFTRLVTYQQVSYLGQRFIGQSLSRAVEIASEESWWEVVRHAVPVPVTVCPLSPCGAEPCAACPGHQGCSLLPAPRLGRLLMVAGQFCSLWMLVFKTRCKKYKMYLMPSKKII